MRRSKVPGEANQRESHRKRCLVACIVVAGFWASPSVSQAHGGLGHMQVTAWAVENLPAGEIRTFMAHPEVFNAILFGAAYPDIGYYPGLKYPEIARNFGDYSHWAHFIQTFIEWIRVNDPPPWTSLESRQRIAFIMGCAAHGFQDEVFDSLFLDQVSHHDGVGQVEADSGTDGFLVMDALVGLIPDIYAPVDALLELYNASGEFDVVLTEDHLVSSMDTMTTFYIDEDAGPVIAEIAGNMYLDELLWTRDHYMDPDIPGSLHAEVYPTMRYIEGLWKQLNGDYSSDDVIMFAYPEPSRRLRSHQAGVPDSWVSLLFSTGVAQQSLTPVWSDAVGGEVAHSQHGTAWHDDWPRIMTLRPTEDLVPGGHYDVHFVGSAPGVGENQWDLDYTVSFQVACDENNPEDCPDLGEIPSARLDGAQDFRQEWTTEIAEEEQDPEKEDSGCAAAQTQLNGLLLLLAGVYLLRRRSLT